MASGVSFDSLVDWTQLVGSLSEDVRIQNLRNNLFDKANDAVLLNLDMDALNANSIAALNTEIFVGKDLVSKRTRRVSRPNLLSAHRSYEISPAQLKYPGRARVGYSGIAEIRIVVGVEFAGNLPNHLSDKAVNIFCETLSKKIITSAYGSISEILDKGVSNIRSNLRSRTALKQLPGTIVSKTLQLVGRYGGSNVTCYCTLYDGNMAIEYVHRNQAKASYKFAKYSFNGTTLRLSPKLREAIDISSTVVINEHNSYDSLDGIINYVKDASPEASDQIDRQGRIVLTKISWRNSITGLILQHYPRASAAIPETASAISESAAAGYSEISRWLLQRRFEIMLIDPIFNSRETRIVEKQAFVVMPFNESWSKDVEAALRDILAQHNYKVIRADDMFGLNIIEDIWTGICRSEIIIVDATGRNPNVYYELGICHAIGKEAIIMTQNVKDIPFDIRHLRHVVYENSLSGFQKLKAGIEGHLQDHIKRATKKTA